MSCPVCFSDAASPAVRESLNAGLFVLLGVTGVVLTAFAAFILRLVRLARSAPLLGPGPELPHATRAAAGDSPLSLTL